jgi:hypothetical protein
MPMTTDPDPTRRAQSRVESRNYPARQAPDAAPLTRQAIIDRLTAANSQPQLPASPAPQPTGEAARGLTLGQRLDLAHGLDPRDALRHRGGGVR